MLHSSIPMMPFHQNLDVNQAVNNLLSRDDDDGGEGEGSEGEHLIPAAFFPSGGVDIFIAVQSVLYCSSLSHFLFLSACADELLSLLGSVGAVDDEDMEEGSRPGREGGGREEGVREEIAGRLSRAVLDELGSAELLVPVSGH